MTYWIISSLDNFLFLGMLGTKSFSLVKSSCISSATIISAGEEGDDDPLHVEEEANCILALDTLLIEDPLGLGEEDGEEEGDDVLVILVEFRKGNGDCISQGIL